VDNRNFELLVDSLTTAQNQPTLPEPAVRALGAVAVRAAAFVRGDKVPSFAIKTEGVSSAGRSGS